jgi:hypothetical protein
MANDLYQELAAPATLVDPLVFWDTCQMIGNGGLRDSDRAMLLTRLRDYAPGIVARLAPHDLDAILREPSLDPDARTVIEAAAREMGMLGKGPQEAAVPSATGTGPEQLSWRARAIGIRADKPGMTIPDVAKLVGIHAGTIYRAAATDVKFRQAMGIRPGKEKLARGATDGRSGNLDGECPRGYSNLED